MTLKVSSNPFHPPMKSNLAYEASASSHLLLALFKLRFIQWVGLEGTFRDPLAQAPMQ